MQDRSDDRSGIFANEIDAENVVSGTQLSGDIGGEDAAQLLALAKDIRGGRIEAAHVRAKNVVSGLQYIKNPDEATTEDLKKELEALRGRLEALVAAGEFDDQGEAADAVNALDTARNELGTEHANGSRVVRKLGELADIVAAVAERASRAGKALAGLSTFAPVAATLWQIAQRLLGG